MIKHILVHVDATTAGKTCLNYAIALARHLDARLTGIHITPPAEIAPLYKPSKIAPALKIIEDRATDDARAAAACFRESTGKTNLERDWKSASGDMAEALGKAAQFADLTVLSQDTWPGPPHRHPLSLAEATLMNGAGPILVVPEAAEPSIPTTARILWDGSQEAARAVHDAMPLIQGCCTAMEVVCCKGSESAELELLVEYLARHGVAVRRLDTIAPDLSCSAIPIEPRCEGGFDILIMGAFSRAPWREILFGGPTLRATRQLAVPLLASH